MNLDESVEAFRMIHAAPSAMLVLFGRYILVEKRNKKRFFSAFS